MPLDSEPADVVAIVQAYADWLSRSHVPKLFVNAEPGAILVGAQREFCRAWPNQTEITVQAAISSRKTRRIRWRGTRRLVPRAWLNGLHGAQLTRESSQPVAPGATRLPMRPRKASVAPRTAGRQAPKLPRRDSIIRRLPRPIRMRA
jgi:hypothetical protein